MTERTKPRLGFPKRSVFWEARTRILVWYVGLMIFLVGLSIPIFIKLVFNQVDRRVREDLKEDLESFQEFVEEETSAKEPTVIFDDFLQERIPEDDTFLIATVEGQFYEASPRGLPKELASDSWLINYLATTTEPIREENLPPEAKVDGLIYKTEPLRIDGQVRGVLVVAHITEGERQEVLDSVTIVIEVLIACLILALILAWIVSGKVLNPIKTLAQTARSISETDDLKQRIPLHGSGELRDLAIAFNNMIERLDRSFATQREFLNDAGHELRTPITIIQGHLELLDDDPQEQQETIELVLDELDRMTSLVENLILLAKADRKDFLQLTTLDVEKLTEKLYSKAQGLASRNWKLEGLAKGSIVADRQRITQAIMNLAGNATQHTEGSDTIAIGSSINEIEARFWVRDTGCGIDKSDQQRIFERFARGTKGKRHSQGSGLGLSIVQAIAKSHGGRIELYSQPGVGSTFTLILPVD